MPLSIVLNGQERSFDGLTEAVTLAGLLSELSLKGDRVAVEHNGQIVQRALWPQTQVASGDRLEIVHFVGGGAPVPLHR